MFKIESRKLKIRRIHIILIIASYIAFASCKGGYSFTGADISPDTKTFTVELFPNRASLVQPTLSNVFTETLKDKFLTATSLHLVNENGDLYFEGEITNYNVTAQAYQGNETSALTRLTIGVRVRFTNNIEPSKSFESSFSRYADFESSQNLSAVEGELMQQICDELVDDIFNKSVANW
ncbi:MAG: LptE family protein [Bacteroidales bacterium]|nr:LptE family protein [Bacteroidales bacterium]